MYMYNYDCAVSPLLLQVIVGDKRQRAKIVCGRNSLIAKSVSSPQETEPTVYCITPILPRKKSKESRGHSQPSSTPVERASPADTASGAPRLPTRPKHQGAGKPPLPPQTTDSQGPPPLPPHITDSQGPPPLPPRITDSQGPPPPLPPHMPTAVADLNIPQNSLTGVTSDGHPPPLPSYVQPAAASPPSPLHSATSDNPLPCAPCSLTTGKSPPPLHVPNSITLNELEDSQLSLAQTSPGSHLPASLHISHSSESRLPNPRTSVESLPPTPDGPPCQSVSGDQDTS